MARINRASPEVKAPVKQAVLIDPNAFKFTGAGHYLVTYTSPTTLKQFSKTITDMQLIDATKNADELLLQKDLEHLKSVCKR